MPRSAVLSVPALSLEKPCHFPLFVPFVYLIPILLFTFSVVLLGVAMKQIPVGTAYAVWTGIGATGTVILGIVLFGEPATAARLACVGLIVAGIVGLKWLSPA